MRSALLFVGSILLAACASDPKVPIEPAPTTTASATVSAPPDREPRFVHQLAGEGGIVLSPDNKHAAVVLQGLTIIDYMTQRVVGRFPHCASFAAFGRDGLSVVVGGCQKAPNESSWVGIFQPEVDVWLWDLTTDTTRQLATGPYDSAEVSRDGVQALLSGPGHAAVIEVATGKQLLQRHGEPSYEGGPAYFPGMGRPYLVAGPRIELASGDVALSPDGVFGADAKGIHRIDDPAKSVCTLETARKRTDIHWSSDGRRVGFLEGTNDDVYATVYDVASCKRTSSLLPTEESRLGEQIYSVTSWSPDLQRVAWASGDPPALHFVEVANGGERTMRAAYAPAFYGAPDGRLVIFEDGGSTTLLDPRTGTFRDVAMREVLALRVQHKGGWEHFLERGKTLPKGTKLVLEDAGKLVPLELSEPFTGPGYSLASGPRDTFVVVEGSETAFWDRKGKRRALFKGWGHLYFSGDQSLVVHKATPMASDGAVQEAIDVASGKRRWSLTTKLPHLDPNWGSTIGVQFAPVGARAAVGGVGVVDENGKVLFSHPDFTHHAWSPDGSVVLTYENAGRDSCTLLTFGEIVARDATTGAVRGKLDGAVYIVGWSKDGKWVAAIDGCGGQQLLVFETSKWERRFVLNARASLGMQELTESASPRARNMTFSADGRFLHFLRASSFVSLRLADGEQLEQLMSGDVQTVAFFGDRFDGGLDLEGIVKYRMGARVLEDPLGKPAGAAPCSGLREDFFAGRDVDCKPGN